MNKIKYQFAKFEYINYRKFWENLPQNERAEVLEIYGNSFDPTKEDNKKFIKTIINQAVQDNLNLLPHQIWRLKDGKIFSQIKGEIKALFAN